jgi:CxxC-x17-CxxC domain-containing protein
MESKFVDRLLTCCDCSGEFIFTAGEQLFFHDKQFKNDPKRCKPCKSRRSGLAGKPTSGPAAAGISRTETRTICSDCGIETTVPFKPTQGRPVLCRQCFQAKGKAAPEAPVLHGDATSNALTALSTNGNGAVLDPAAAVLASTSIANAPAHSSVATAVDLASISHHDTHDDDLQRPVAEASKLDVPAELVSSELLAAASSSAEA